jgi:hypothetical protein
MSIITVNVQQLTPGKKVAEIVQIDEIPPTSDEGFPFLSVFLRIKEPKTLAGKEVIKNFSLSPKSSWVLRAFLIKNGYKASDLDRGDIEIDFDQFIGRIYNITTDINQGYITVDIDDLISIPSEQSKL